MLKVHIEIDEDHLKELIKQEIENVCGGSINVSDVAIEVKSKQNYKAEWEVAKFRAVYDSTRL